MDSRETWLFSTEVVLENLVEYYVQWIDGGSLYHHHRALNHAHVQASVEAACRSLVNGYDFQF
jgi:hypothetical protein